MNSSSSAKTYMRMQNTIMQNPKSKCFLVEVIAKTSQNKPWQVSLDGIPVSDERIRRVSLDRFYQIVTGDELAFKKLCEVLPLVIQDCLRQLQPSNLKSPSHHLLSPHRQEAYNTLFKLSFGTYMGFDAFQVRL